MEPDRQFYQDGKTRLDITVINMSAVEMAQVRGQGDGTSEGYLQNTPFTKNQPISKIKDRTAAFYCRVYSLFNLQ